MHRHITLTVSFKPVAVCEFTSNQAMDYTASRPDGLRRTFDFSVAGGELNWRHVGQRKECGVVVGPACGTSLH